MTSGHSDWERLTDAERSIPQLVAVGLTNREALGKLFLSPHTVDYQLPHIFREHIDSRVQLTRIVEKNRDNGLTDVVLRRWPDEDWAKGLGERSLAGRYALAVSNCPP